MSGKDAGKILYGLSFGRTPSAMPVLYTAS